MSRNSLLLLASVLLSSSCASHKQLAQDERMDVLNACPGVAAWDRQHHKGNSKATEMKDQSLPALPLLREQILEMAEQDQIAREEASSVPFDINSQEFKKIEGIDAANLVALRKLVDRYGFPTASQIGSDGLSALWLLVQHSSRDTDFQEMALESFMRPASEINKSEVAMLVDQIRIAKNQPQMYGTQIRRVDGKPVPYPIDNPDSVDSRRAEMNLMPLSAYLCAIAETYSIKNK